VGIELAAERLPHREDNHHMGANLESRCAHCGRPKAGGAFSTVTYIFSTEGKIMSVNKVILVGRLGKDPELTYSQSGVPVCRFSLATNEKFKDQGGVLRERAEWHNIVCFANLAEVCGQYLSKGKLLSKASDKSDYRQHLFIVSKLPIGTGQGMTGKISFR
jgi:hypothetical protein